MKTSHQILQTIKILVLALILATGLQYVVAESVWVSAPNDPPNHNVDAPINVGSAFQSKTGNLHVNSTTNNPDPFGLVAWQGIKSISTAPGAARVVSDERGDTATSYSGFEVKNAAGTQGGFFKKGVTNDLVISNKIGPVVTVKQDGTTEFAGTVKISGGNPGANKVLTSDANGLAQWANPSSSNWQGTTHYHATDNAYATAQQTVNLGIFGNGSNDYKFCALASYQPVSTDDDDTDANYTRSPYCRVGTSGNTWILQSGYAYCSALCIK